MSEMDSFVGCRHITHLLRIEKKVIRDHLAEHKWFRHIEDENEGVIAFIEEYGWIMREMYCGCVCKDRKNCELAQRFVQEDDPDDGD